MADVLCRHFGIELEYLRNQTFNYETRSVAWPLDALAEYIECVDVAKSWKKSDQVYTEGGDPGRIPSAGCPGDPDQGAGLAAWRSAAWRGAWVDFRRWSVVLRGRKPKATDMSMPAIAWREENSLAIIQGKVKDRLVRLLGEEVGAKGLYVQVCLESRVGIYSEQLSVGVISPFIRFLAQ
jgi:hypothetical protein